MASEVCLCTPFVSTVGPYKLRWIARPDCTWHGRFGVHCKGCLCKWSKNPNGRSFTQMIHPDCPVHVAFPEPAAPPAGEGV